MRHRRHLTLVLLALGLILADASRAQDGNDPSPTDGTEDGGWTVIPLEHLGLDPALREYGTLPKVTLYFSSRADEVLTDARLRLEIDALAVAAGETEGLRISVNGEVLDELDLGDLLSAGEILLPMDARILGTENAVTLELLGARLAGCEDRLERGRWGLIADGTLETRGSPLPLQDDLALLPLPFVDPRADRAVTVPVVFAGPPAPDTVAAAGLVAAYLGLRTSAELSFEVSVGELPDSRAVVLLVGDENLPLASLPRGDSPTVRLVDHPRLGSGRDKLLLLHGATPAELRQAATALAMAGDMEGAVLTVDEAPSPPPRRPYDAPRWLPVSSTIRLEDVTGGEELIHRGLNDETLEVSFRIAPDLFTWPDEIVELTVEATQVAPVDELAPTIHVELNGEFVDTLPRPQVRQGIARHRAVLDVHRSLLRGYNVLKFHLSWPDPDLVCDRGGELADAVVTTIHGGTTLHLGDIPHFARLPDVARFVDDGFPFTRVADLGETRVVLPGEASGPELATVMSLMAHFAGITGYPGIAAEFVDVRALGELDRRDRDVLVIGQAEILDHFPTWEDDLPVVHAHQQLLVRQPRPTERLQTLLAGQTSKRRADAVAELLTRDPDVALVQGLQVPAGEGRTAVVVTANRVETMPAAHQLTGFTEADLPGGDLLLIDGDTRSRFRIGAGFDVGELDAYTRLRWTSAQHWTLLIPFLLFGSLLVTGVSHRSLRLRARRRLDQE